ncbi:TPA: hypothetical protein N0F65_002956, partial [Lagenidium giganteum]
DYVLRSRVDQKANDKLLPSRLKYYADDSFEVTQEIREHVVLSVAALHDHRWNKSKRCYELVVMWRGLDPIENSWESLQSLPTAISKLVSSYSSHVQVIRLHKRCQV